MTELNYDPYIRDPRLTKLLNTLAIGIAGVGCLAVLIVGWTQGEALTQPTSTPAPTATNTPTPEPTATPTIPPTGNAVEGQLVYLGLRCDECHGFDDIERVGPRLDGISQRVPEGFASAEAYLVESILDPSAYLTEGYPAVMPENYADALSDQDLANLVAFLMSQ